MNPAEIKSYYSRPEIQEKLLELSRSREIAGTFRNGEYGKRPNTLLYPDDILAMVKSGTVEFHSSLERWSNPMLIKGSEYQDLRVGWDLVIDIDCKDFEHGKLGALAVMDALKRHGMEGFSVKFTGGTGWHIGIPWESIPKEVGLQQSVGLFPDIARHVGLYLKHCTREALEKEFLKSWSPEDLANKVGKTLGELSPGDSVLDPWQVIEIDPVLISPRHLFRMPYSINYKKGLASLPLKHSQVKGFEPQMAKPDSIPTEMGFLDSGRPGEAETLFLEGLDWYRKMKKDEPKPVKKMQFDRAVPKEMFPPCIKRIMEGVEDGRKRSVFILVNFLASAKWPWPEVERALMEWNRKNNPPLPDNYIVGQYRYAQRRGKPIPPPNCDNLSYYKGFGACQPDNTCKTLKNPVSYPFRLLNIKKGNKKQRK